MDIEIQTYWAEDARTLLHDMNLWAAVPCAAIASGAMCCWLYLACGLHVGGGHLEAPYYEKMQKSSDVGRRSSQQFVLGWTAILGQVVTLPPRAGYVASDVACVQILGLVSVL